MNSPLELLPAAIPAAAPAAAIAPLSLLAARLGGRLAALLRRVELGGAGCSFLEAMAAAAEAVAPASPSSCAPLERLARAFGLSACELDLLVFAGLGEEHEGFADVFRSIHPQHRPWPTLGLAAQVLLDGGDLAAQNAARLAFRRLVEGGPARRAGLFSLDSGELPFFDRGILPAEGLWSALHELDAWPERLQPEPPAPASDAGLADFLGSPAAREAIAALRRGAAATVWIADDDAETAGERALALARAAGRHGEAPPCLAWRLPAAATAENLRLLLALAVARGVLPLLQFSPGDTGGGPTLNLRDADFPAVPILVAGRPGELRFGGARPLLQVLAEKLGPGDLGRLWAAALPSFAPDAALLAAAYPVEAATVRQIAADLAQLEALRGEPATLADVAAAIRWRTGISAGGGVQLIRPRADWSQLVLPPAKLAVLQEAVARLFHQRRVLDDWKLLAGRPGARGVRLLFTGPPGTGKTFSAEVLARALGVDLLVVDLSRVLSKWIGETEKNLAEVFATAEKARAVLLFDEADALFGKRTEVQDAHDRYANLETAYLLARLEKFDGLAILATNLRQNLDHAFVRRLEFLVDFEEPGRDERLALWQRHLPATAPRADSLDLHELAGLFPLSGGLIKNAAVAAAFLAAGAGEPIGRGHLLHAIRREYEKAGKAFPGLPPGRDLT